jgi:hypothetical protein
VAAAFGGAAASFEDLLAGAQRDCGEDEGAAD